MAAQGAAANVAAAAVGGVTPIAAAVGGVPHIDGAFALLRRVPYLELLICPLPRDRSYSIKELKLYPSPYLKMSGDMMEKEEISSCCSPTLSSEPMS